MKPTVQIDIIKPTRAQRIAAVLAVVALFAFGGARICKAVTPAPDGGYANANTAEGTSALFSLTSGTNNTALGFHALYDDTNGSSNTATGWNAQRFNTSGTDNTATGAQALYKNTVGTFNTAVGRNALLLNTGGSFNTAVGAQALQSSVGGQATAVGFQALYNNISGFSIAIGCQTLFSNTTGDENNAMGDFALYNNTTGIRNTAVGSNALEGTTGSYNTAIGAGAGGSLTSGDGNVCIGENVFGTPGESNTTHIRNIYSSIATTRAVYVNSDNKIGTLSSSRRYKDEIKPIDAVSETLFALRPVSFRYKKEVDRSRALSFGLIAEEVAEVNPDLITRDKEGRPQTVRYEAVNAMLLNEFLKEHAKVQQLEATVDALATQIKEQNAKIEKVSAQLQTRRAISPVALNNP